MQSSKGRAIVALAAIAVIAAAFVVLSGSGDSDDGGSETTAVATTTAQGKQADEPAKKEEPSEPAIETIDVAGGQPADGPAELAYTQGDEVRIAVESDAESEFHLHGYDIEAEAAPGKPAEFRFTADIEGKFELEDHHSGALIAELTVNP